MSELSTPELSISLPDEKFWDFSVRTYYVEGVADAVLELQDTQNADINLLLFCIWVGANYGDISDTTFDEAIDFSKDWANNVVIPLRETRRWMKSIGCSLSEPNQTSCMELREKIKGIECAAEKHQESALEGLCASLVLVNSTRQGKQTSALNNIVRYFDQLPDSDLSVLTDSIRLILEAAIPD